MFLFQVITGNHPMQTLYTFINITEFIMGSSSHLFFSVIGGVMVMLAFVIEGVDVNAILRQKRYTKVRTYTVLVILVIQMTYMY